MLITKEVLNMQKLLKYTVCIASLVAASSSFAASNGSAAAQSKKTNTNNDWVLLYKAKQSNDVVAKISPASRLVPIIQKGEWVKVGNPQNGQVGWINLNQYQQARNDFYRPDIQTVYVSMKQSKQGKPTWNIVAYKNGKQLTSKQAKQLYQRWRNQQITWQQNWQRNWRRNMWTMNRWMDQQLWQAQQMMNTAWRNAPWAEPIVVMPSLPTVQNWQSQQTSRGTAVSAEQNS
jgi:hypothetical protein